MTHNHSCQRCRKVFACNCEFTARSNEDLCYECLRAERNMLVKELKLERNLGIEAVQDAVAPYLVTISKLKAELAEAKKIMKEMKSDYLEMEAERDDMAEQIEMAIRALQPRHALEDKA